MTGGFHCGVLLVELSASGSGTGLGGNPCDGSFLGGVITGAPLLELLCPFVLPLLLLLPLLLAPLPLLP